MLAQNNLPSGNSLKFFGGAGIGSLAGANQRTNWSINNALCFGENVSWPQGCNDVNCTRMQLEDLNEYGNIALRTFGEGFSSFVIEGLGELSSTMQGEGTTNFNAEVAYERNVMMQGEGAVTVDLDALGELSVSVDAGARPSAYDIMQEVWQAKASGFPDSTTMGGKLNAAGTAGDPWGADLSSYPPGTAGNILYSLDPQQLADAILNDPKMLTVAKFLGLK